MMKFMYNVNVNIPILCSVGNEKIFINFFGYQYRVLEPKKRPESNLKNRCLKISVQDFLNI